MNYAITAEAVNLLLALLADIFNLNSLVPVTAGIACYFEITW
jgi:hypothetical protein